MTYARDPRLDEAKALSVTEVVDRLGIPGLRQNGWELSGPCPECGSAGHNPKSGPPDRFNINVKTKVFFCRRCGLRGGDLIALVQEVQKLDFPGALAFLCGDLDLGRDPEAQRQIEARRAAARQRAERQAKRAAQDAEKYRQDAIADAMDIWRAARPGEGTLARAYLEARGIAADALPQMPKALRFLPDHPYAKVIGGHRVTAHRGPCMIAGVAGRDGLLRAVHQTWIAAAPPHGKAAIRYCSEDLAAKLVRGSKKGGAIRLINPEGATTLVMGEGIETTLSVFAAGLCSGAAFWAGVDLGNMAGKAAKVPGERWHGLPDLDDTEAFVPPAWVRELIYLMDGDSHPRATRHKLMCGLRRAMALRPGLKARIVPAPAGKDFNDLLRGAPQAPGDEVHP